jgi:DNA topoisomerase-1
MAKKKATDLVIVESPAKAKTIGRYLGSDYTVVASMGHLRDLPKSTLGVDVEHGFTPKYIPVKDRKDVIANLRKLSKGSDAVYLATDPDREGEAISWHLKELLNLPDDKTRRVTFNEITRRVVLESIQNPREIDIDLVNAQQARRILDRLVGYKLSPFLWKKVRRGLSAGRVQSVATRMVVDREKEIQGFQSREYWLLDAWLKAAPDQHSFAARYYGTAGKKKELGSREEVDRVLDDIRDVPFIIDTVKKGQKHRSPSPPFITSTLQQEASRRLGMSPRRTMAVAQTLYEGVDVKDHGTIGLISYMRTDSQRLSEEALAAAGSFIRSRYGTDYYNGPRRYKSSAGAQDAHEAIRPTDITLSPDVVRGSLTQDQYRLYRLIWCRFAASQMSNAVYDSVAIDIKAGEHLFKTNYSQLKFPGYTAVYEDTRDEEDETVRRPLPEMKPGQTVLLEKMDPQQQFTQPPSRYTEATLIRAMEANGIGRPSTYAPILSNIMSKDYVVKEGKYLKPTPVGETVTQVMEDHFSDIVDPKFTADMESQLDEIEAGKRSWQDVLQDFYTDFSEELDKAETDMEGVRVRIPAEVTDEKCPNCGANLVIKYGRFGRFLACPNFPECDYTKPMVITMPGSCPKCGSRILKRTSRKGYTFYACERGPECGFMTWEVPTAETCPSCGKTLFKHSGRGRKKPFCINESCPQFVPEEKRSYHKKAQTKSDREKSAADGAKKSQTKKGTASSKKSSTARKKTAEKETAAKA